MTTTERISPADAAPLVTVVTVCYDAAANIEPTISSIAPHLSAAVEYIVIDGGSRDETLDIIERHRSSIRYHVSEPDGGIYDAMNKGIQQAKGQFILFINAGDILQAIPLEELKKRLDADLVCFPVKVDGKYKKRPRLGFLKTVTNTLPHQGCFYRRRASLKYDTRFRVYADYDLNIRMMKANGVITVLDEPVVAVHMLDGISNHAQSAAEFFSIIRLHFGVSQEIVSFIYFKFRGLYFRVRKRCS